MFKKLLLAISIGAIILPTAAFAQSTNSTVPEFNPLCWKQKDCWAQRASFLRKTVDQLTDQEKDGWKQGEGKCGGKEWGMCLPAGETVTEISFGGQRRFSNIGELILVIYKYSLGVGGIIAVIMIFVAGLQWITSGGNAERVTSAKKRIGGAIMGAFLLYLSYFILSTLNPALVNLRLPRIWLLKPAALVPQFCSQAPSTTIFGFAVGAKEQDKVLSATNTNGVNFTLTYSGKPDKPKENPELNKTWDPKTFWCGSRFYVKNGGNSTCFGNVCDQGLSCSPFTVGSDGKIIKKADCTPGQLIIHYYINAPMETLKSSFPFVGNLNGSNWLDTTSVFWGVCKSRTSGVLTIGDKYENWTGGSEYKNVIPIPASGGGFNEYYISYGGFDTAWPKDHWNCPTASDLVGFVMKNEINGKWDWGYNPNLNIGMSGGAPVAGVWGTDVKVENYIPYDSLIKSSIYLDLGVDDSILNHVTANKGSEPSKSK